MVRSLIEKDIVSINEINKEHGWNEITYDEVLSNPFNKYLVFIDKDKIKGYLCYALLYEKIEIVYIGVLKEFQNKKVASSLVEELLKISENSKCENITLEVNVDNKNAIKLYQKYGFKESSRRVGYYNGVDAILMIRE